jgi:hypothetical protein
VRDYPIASRVSCFTQNGYFVEVMEYIGRKRDRFVVVARDKNVCGRIIGRMHGTRNLERAYEMFDQLVDQHGGIA